MIRKSRLIGAFAALMCATSALAAPVTNAVVTPQTPNAGGTQFVQGTDAAGTFKTVYTGNNTGNAAGSKCKALFETNTDGSVAHAITVEVTNGSGTVYYQWVVNTAVNDGNANGVPPKNLFSTTYAPQITDSDGIAYVFLPPGWLLKAAYATALTTSTQIQLLAPCDDF